MVEPILNHEVTTESSRLMFPNKALVYLIMFNFYSFVPLMR